MRANPIDYDSNEESWEDSSESSEECEDCEDWSDGSSIPEDRCLYLDTPPTARYNIKVSLIVYWLDAVGSSQIFFPTQNLERAY